MAEIFDKDEKKVGEIKGEEIWDLREKIGYFNGQEVYDMSGAVGYFDGSGKVTDSAGHTKGYAGSDGNVKNDKLNPVGRIRGGHEFKGGAALLLLFSDAD